MSTPLNGANGDTLLAGFESLNLSSPESISPSIRMGSADLRARAFDNFAAGTPGSGYERLPALSISRASSPPPSFGTSIDFDSPNSWADTSGTSDTGRPR